jgi:FAD/FMN-containing dehydrogenase
MIQHPPSDLRPHLHDELGEVVVPGDPGYAEASRTFGASGAPAMIVRPRDADEVARAVRRAVSEGLALSVRSGGHSPIGASTNFGGIVIDLTHFDAVELVDAERRLVRVGAGATWGPVAAALAPHGLGLTAGDTTGVGVGGLTLGGGIGWMVRKHGLAIDNLVAARVVTADGRVVTADRDRHPDLFWALRGGGGNFGIVRDFDFVAQRVSTVHMATIAYRLDDAAGLVAGWRDHLRSAPEELTSTLTLMPAMMGGEPSALVQCCFAGDDADAAAAATDPLLSLGTVTDWQVTARPFAGILEDAHHPPGIRVVARNVMVPELDDAAVTSIARAVAQEPAPVLSLRSLGGAVARVPASATAFAHRDAEAMVVSGTLVPADADDAFIDRALAPWRLVAAHGRGAYVNFLGSATAEDVRTAYPPATLARLAVVKQVYDPHNVFRRNLNVVPDDADRTEGPVA